MGGSAMPPVSGRRHRGRRSSDRAAHRHDRAAAGADQVVDVLYRAHYQSLARVAALLVSDTAAAEDIVQAAFVSLHRGWRYLGDEERALAYLRRAVVSGTRSRDAASADWPSRLRGAPSASWPGDSIPRTLLVAALQAVPARQREALVLRYYAAWPDGQIAAAMGISGRAVMRHTARGMSALRACGVLDWPEAGRGVAQSTDRYQ
jgi:DNA-directed RNA polymerase specialized sigma24 family protein